MRVLLTCLPGFGSFYPMAPFARALQKAGHTVAFVTSADFKPNIERCGFETMAGGAHLFTQDPCLAEPFARFQAFSSDFERLLFMYTEVFRHHRPKYMIPDLLKIAQSWQPDIIIRESIEFGGCIVAELLGLPHAMVGAMEFFPAHVEQAFQPALDNLRRSQGLPPDPEGLMSHRYLTITGTLPDWVGTVEVCPPVTHFVRPVQFDNIEDVKLPDWIEKMPDRPTVHASMGTVFNRVPGNYEAIIQGLRDEPINLIVAIGPDRNVKEFGPQPENVRFEPYLPHSLLLPHCDVMISHAGYGAAMACLLNAVPAVMLPVTGDQPHNAQRFAELGAGIVIQEAFRSPENVHNAVFRILGNGRYRDRAQDAQHRLNELPAPEYSVRLLEQLVAEKQPIITRRQIAD